MQLVLFEAQFNVSITISSIAQVFLPENSLFRLKMPFLNPLNNVFVHFYTSLFWISMILKSYCWETSLKKLANFDFFWNLFQNILFTLKRVKTPSAPHCTMSLEGFFGFYRYMILIIFLNISGYYIMKMKIVSIERWWSEFSKKIELFQTWKVTKIRLENNLWRGRTRRLFFKYILSWELSEN